MSEWIETAKRPPTEADAITERGNRKVIWAITSSGLYTAPYWANVADEPLHYPHWQPITPPEPPEHKAFDEWFAKHKHIAGERDAFLAGVQWHKEQGK